MSGSVGEAHLLRLGDGNGEGLFVIPFALFLSFLMIKV